MRLPSDPLAAPTPRALAPGRAAAPGGPQADSPEAAAREFERVLAKQFAATMTESLFEDGLAGEDGPGWMGGYRDAQRDVLTDALADHLVESGSLRVRDLLLRNWQQSGTLPETPSDAPAALPADAPASDAARLA